MSRPQIDPLKYYLTIIITITVLSALAVVVFDWPASTVQALAWDIAVPLLVLTAIVLFVRELLNNLSR